MSWRTVFARQEREEYRLERLWGDAPAVLRNAEGP